MRTILMSIVRFLKGQVRPGSILNGNQFDSPSFRCSVCGHPLEPISRPMESDAPSVYKCPSCRCTVTFPGTLFPTDRCCERDPIINRACEKIVLRGKEHLSVGYEYNLTYSSNAFRSKRKIRYLYPEKMQAEMCGGDEAVVEYSLYPLECGLFNVLENIYFRGKLECRYIHYFLVED